MSDTQASVAQVVAERVWEAIAGEVLSAVDGESFAFTCSIGIGVPAGATTSPEELLQAADAWR